MAESPLDVVRKWLDDKACPIVATIEPDGRPQLSAIWAKLDGEEIVFSTLRDRRKGRNLASDPRASVIVSHPADPYQTVEIRGTATIVDDPGGSLIKELGRHYDDGAEFVEPDVQASRRIIVRVSAEHVVPYGL